MKCQFEEKSYESLLNAELATSGKYFPVGQKLEHLVGVDGVLFSGDTWFWNLFGDVFPPYPPRGVLLEPRVWSWIEHRINNFSFPRWIVNVFIQNKRPEYVTRSNGKEWGRWNQEYFRYSISQNQQQILEKLEEEVTKTAIVVYACPAFWRVEELAEFSTDKKLVTMSNFVQPHKLKDHQRYTFIKGGKDGEVHSEPKHVEGIILTEEIDKLLERKPVFTNNTDLLYSTSSAILRVVEGLDKDFRSAFEKFVKVTMVPDHSLAVHLKKIIIFIWLTGINWGVAYRNHFKAY